jgi:hypothetical protein
LLVADETQRRPDLVKVPGIGAEELGLTGDRMRQRRFHTIRFDPGTGRFDSKLPFAARGG